MADFNSAIDTFVVLVLENRSFDHMLGFLRSPAYPIDGLTGSESNPLDPHVSPPKLVQVTPDAQYYGDLDNPGHSLNPAVIRQLYGLSDAQIQKLSTYPKADPSNNGFVYDYASEALGAGAAGPPPVVAANVMKCFAPAKLPVLAGLAQNFAICDHWFSSVPGPTLPNRWFIHCGTSGGYVGGSLKLTALNTIQQLLSMNGRTWKVYYGDVPHALTLMRLWDQPLVQGFVSFEQFAKDAASGKLPNYAFIEPRYFLAANDQHPPHPVDWGEQLIAGVYNALRSSPQWTRSMLIVTYDEHGGTYDHVPPPRTTSPDGLTAYDDDGNVYLSFHFDRLGVRVPAVVVSPYVPKGTIASTAYEHTSILRTIEDRFALPALSRRDATANSLAGIASLSAPRDDAPVRIDPPAQTAASAGDDPPLSDLQRQLLELARILPGPEPPAPTVSHQAAVASGSERAAGTYAAEKVRRWLRSS